MTPSSKSAIVLVANGSEEMEAVITIDLLRRSGIDVAVVSVESTDLTVECSRKVRIVADYLLSSFKEKSHQYDALVLPGGLGGARKFQHDHEVQSLIKQFQEQGKLIAVICASPIALKETGLFSGRRLTSHPSMKVEIAHEFYVEERVVVDGNLITSRGPGTTFEFAFAIIEHLLSKEAAELIKAPLILKS